VLPDTDVARARQWVERRNDRLPERARGQIRYELDVADRFVTVFECRPHGFPKVSTMPTIGTGGRCRWGNGNSFGKRSRVTIFPR